MRIISKFKDYYDSVQAYGQDERCTYLRKTEEIEITDKNFIELVKDVFESGSGSVGGLNREQICLLGFCGKVYPMWKFSFKWPNDIYHHIIDTYIVSDISNFLSKYKSLKEDLEVFLKKPNGAPHYLYEQKLTKTDINETINLVSNTKRFEKLFFEHKTPTFVITHEWDAGDRRYVCKLTLNPCLKDYGFYKQKDAFTAYQDINQYISGILGLNDPDIVHISDKDMKSQKGFYEYSFKTLPSKKR